MNHLRRLIGHLAWADRLALEALERADGADRRLVDLYAHVVAAEHVWLARLTGTRAAVPVWPTLSLAECERLGTETAEALRRYVDSLTPADLARGITYRNSAGAEFTSLVEDILLHVCLHGSYHRGQIASGLRAGGAIPNPTDYIAFVRGAPAATRADRR